MPKIYPVIMSGGAGTRLWPISRKAKPKQYHALISENTMFCETLVRLENCRENDVAPAIVICADGHQDLIKAQSDMLDIPLTAIILEPMGRNTAAVGAIAATYVNSIDPDGLVLLLPADHHIEDTDAFWDAVSKGAATAAKGYLMTFGILPTGPETGFGYIQCGEPLATDVCKISSFKEKPNEETAKQYLSTGEYFWNAGIFLFNVDRLIKEFTLNAKDILDQSTAALNAAKVDGLCVHLDAELFAACRSDSIDYAIMEKTAYAGIVTSVDAGWNDIGSWAAISAHLRDGETSLGLGDVKLIDTRNSYVKSEGPFVATIGVKDLVVVAMNDAVLIVDSSRTQDIKLITEYLKSTDRTDLL